MPLNTMLEWVFRVRASRRCGHVEMNRPSAFPLRRRGCLCRAGRSFPFAGSQIFLFLAG